MKTIALRVARTTPGQLAFHACRVRPAIGFDRCREFHGPAATITRGPNGTTFLFAILEAHHPLHVPFPSLPLSIERTPTRDDIRPVSASPCGTFLSDLILPGRVRDANALAKLRLGVSSAHSKNSTTMKTELPVLRPCVCPNCHFIAPLPAGTNFFRLRN